MDVSTLLADPTAIHLEALVSNDDSITLRVRSIQPQATCPLCSVLSGSLHSNYVRLIADLPWHNVAVHLELHTRKFRCRNRLCQQKIFCERLPKVACKYARKTARLEAVLTYLAFALGGEVGQRAAEKLQVTVSGDTLLRLIRRRINQSALEMPGTKPRIIGVDDWAWRKAHSYGTIIVDLERRKVIDLLPDREAETLAEWLRKHQTVETVARDRSPTYRCGIVEGQPDAVQVADRWHLLKNLTDCLKCLIERLQRKKKTVAPNDIKAIDFVETIRHPAPNFDLPQSEQMEDLLLAVARINRQTRQFRLLPHLPTDWVAKSQPTTRTVATESSSRVGTVDAPIKANKTSDKFDARTLVKLCCRRMKLNEKESEMVERARDEWEEFDRAVPLAEEFVKIVRGQSEWKLSQWIVRANDTKIKELKSFANGLQQDFFAVKEAFVSEWSNGQTEGQVNRLKLIKRSMYGRAKFDLLRARVLHRA